MPGVGGAGDFYSFQVWCSLGGGSEMGDGNSGPLICLNWLCGM